MTLHASELVNADVDELLFNDEPLKKNKVRKRPIKKTDSGKFL